MAKIKAKLRVLDLRGETVSTRWGDVVFDREGLAELEVEEEDLPLLRGMRPFSWLAEDHAPKAAGLPQEVPIVPPPADDASPAETVPAGSEEAPQPAAADASDSDMSGGGKKSGKKGR